MEDTPLRFLFEDGHPAYFRPSFVCGVIPHGTNPTALTVLDLANGTRAIIQGDSATVAKALGFEPREEA